MKKHLLLGLFGVALSQLVLAQGLDGQYTRPALTTHGRVSAAEAKIESVMNRFRINSPIAGERLTAVPAQKVLRGRLGHPPVATSGYGELELHKVRRIDSDMARITLDVTSDWGDGSGYQLLLDPDCIIYFLTESGHINQIYDEADYKIPENAENMANFLIAGQSGSVDIPGGEYDFLLFNPTPTSNQVYLPGGQSEGDDVRFVAGYEYVFTITHTWDSDNCAVTCDTPSDLAVTAVSSPASGLDLGSAEDVTITVANVGETDVTQFEASYTINGGAAVTESVNVSVPAGGSVDYTFTAKADLSAPGIYTIKAGADAPDDAMTLNNSYTAEIMHISPLSPPYNCTFEDEDDVYEWDIIDANGDGYTWDIMSYGEGIGFATLYYNSVLPSDDYIIMRSPIALTEGDAHIEVVYNGMAEGYTEKMALLWGDTPDVGSMSVLHRFEGFTATDEGYTTPVTFTVPATGNYYFAFHGYSDADEAGVLLNEITIDEGAYSGTPDLSIDRLVLPLSSCSLGDGETVGVTLTNVGTGGISAFTLSCEVNGEAMASETFDTAIGIGETVVVEFDAKADFSAEDVYTVVVTATDVVPDDGQGDEVETGNNTATGTVTHFVPVDVPLVASFDDEEQRGWWTSDGSWNYDDMYAAYACTGTGPLLSRGINLTGGKAYTIDFNYMAGQNFFFQTYDQYDIVCGLDGTDPQTWDVVYNSADEYTDGLFADRSVSFSVSADGVYSVAFRQANPVGTFLITRVSITEAADYDISVAIASTLPTMLPEEQLADMTLDVTVSNRGSESASGTVTLSIDGTEAGTAAFAALAGAESTVVSVPVAAGAMVSGTMRFEVNAVIDGHDDGNPSDNTVAADVSLLLTDDLLAYDSVEDDIIDTYTNSAIGLQSGYIVVGVPVRINVATWLKGFRLGWGDADAKPFDMLVFAYDPSAAPVGDGAIPVGELLLSASADKQSGTSVTTYTLDEALRLEPGDYMLGVGYEGYGLAVDRVAPGRLYAVSEESGLGWVAYDQASAGFGTAALRAVIDSNLSGIDEAGMDGGDVTVTVDGGMLTVMSAAGVMTRVDVCAMSGVTVCSSHAGGTVFSCDVSSLPAGVYVVRIETDGGVVTRKIAVR